MRSTIDPGAHSPPTAHVDDNPAFDDPDERNSLLRYPVRPPLAHGLTPPGNVHYNRSAWHRSMGAERSWARGRILAPAVRRSLREVFRDNDCQCNIASQEHMPQIDRPPN